MTVRLSALLLFSTALCSCAIPPPPRPVEAPRQPDRAPLPPTSAPQESPQHDQQPVLVGTVIKVTDGDTIKVQLSSGPITVRFNSIDAPEKNQPWGVEAQAALAQRIDQQQVVLDVTTQDRYERLVADVYLGDERVNKWMVQQGHAWGYRQYIRDEQYCRWESAARSASRGLWALPDYHAPWEWRDKQLRESGDFTDYSNETPENCIAAIPRRKRADDSSRAAPVIPPEGTRDDSCNIKGNISKNGDRIYHVPGSSSYNSTIIVESKGERWFCSENEARTTGWRAPRQ